VRVRAHPCSTSRSSRSASRGGCGARWAWNPVRRFPSGTEARLARFTELAATAIANAEAHAALAVSRARIVATSDATRRRIERNLHDGAQQRLVSLALDLRAAEAGAPPGTSELVQQLHEVAAGMGGVLEDLRETLPWRSGSVNSETPTTWASWTRSGRAIPWRHADELGGRQSDGRCRRSTATSGSTAAPRRGYVGRCAQSRQPGSTQAGSSRTLSDLPRLPGHATWLRSSTTGLGR
jgi:hypothetical protein